MESQIPQMDFKVKMWLDAKQNKDKNKQMKPKVNLSDYTTN